MKKLLFQNSVDFDRCQCSKIFPTDESMAETCPAIVRRLSVSGKEPNCLYQYSEHSSGAWTEWNARYMKNGLVNSARVRSYDR
jgi:hypothetical protein